MDKLSILYVDDEPDIREIATMSLQLDPSIEVRTADSGPAAINLLKEGSWSPSIILLDVMMPIMDGPGALARIRDIEGYAETPVVFITASVQADERARLMAIGATAVIAKPFDPMTLASQLRSVLAAGEDVR